MKDFKGSIHIMIVGLMMLLVFTGSSPQGRKDKGFVYKDPVRHFSIQFPEGWRRIPQKELLARIEETAQSATGIAELARDMILGFCLAGNGDFQFPYIFVFYKEAELPTFDEIAEAHRKFNMDEEFKNLEKKIEAGVQDAKAGSVYVDKRKKIIYRISHAKVAQDKDIGILTAFCVGKNRYAVINCYSEASQFSEMQPTFESIVRTFAFEFGYAYEDMYHIENRYWRIIVKSRLIPVIAVGLGVFLIVYLKKKRSNKLKKRELNENL